MALQLARAAAQGRGLAPPRPAHRTLTARAIGRQRLVVAANWGAPVEWSTAKLVQSAPEAEQLRRLVLDVGGLAGGQKPVFYANGTCSY